MNVIVTGATGTLGLACVEMLIRAGHQVRAFVRDPAKFKRLCFETRVEVVEGDILDRASVAAALETADAAIHCVDFAPSQYSLHWEALQYLLEGLGPRKQLVYPGNVWVYGTPEAERLGPNHPKASPSRLGTVKADLEKAVTAEDGTVVRLPDVYGPGVYEGRLRSIFERALTGKTLYIRGGLDRSWECLYAADAARALISPLERPRARGADYTAPGFSAITPREFASLIFQAAGHAPRIRPLPKGIHTIFQLLRREHRARRELAYLDHLPILLDGTRIRQELGWVPEVNYRDGVKRTVKWIRGSRS
ncbi:MAG: hypothetical protein AMS21_03805 [Gemmatimonas sp. SG8_38_2]|nr:MAG: hypothetical protein AMS21_03805 [Gemmatimonas sp. SG8_38_2]